MARDDGSGNATVQKKLFGPFNGLNGTQSPFLRELPPSANAAPREFATEFENLIIDPKTQDLISRYGMEYCEKGSADPATSSLAATAGLFSWVDYDALTGKAYKRMLNLSVDEDGVPSIYDYRLIKTQLRLTDNSLSGKLFSIIEDPDTADAKRFIFYNVNGAVHTSATTLAGVANVSISYVDYDADRDGAFITGAVDLVAPTAITYSATSGTSTDVVEFWSLCKKTTTNTDLDLSAWIDTLDDSDANYMTAAPASNVMYFSGGGVCPVLKYDGQSLMKAGAPHAALHGTVAVTRLATASFNTAYGFNPTSLTGGLVMNNSLAAPVGRFSYINTYEARDAKNNFNEGLPYIPADFFRDGRDGLSTESDSLRVKFRYTTQPNDAVLATVNRYAPKSVLSSDGFDARGALMPPDACTYSQSGTTTVTVTKTAHGLAVNSYIKFIGLSGSAADAYAQITGVTTNTFTFIGASLTTSGDCLVMPVLISANVASNFTLPALSASNTLKKYDLVCIKAVLYPDTTSYVTGRHIPVIITAKLADKSSTVLTIDASYPITIELCPGGDPYANAAGGFLNDTASEGRQAVLNELLSLTSWADLAAWTWTALATHTRIILSADFCISNNFRINVWRNKANRNEGNDYDPEDPDTGLIPEYYLHNILPNNPFASTTDIGGGVYDNCLDACLGALLTERVPLEVNDTDGLDFSADVYSPLPKGRSISTFKGRLYIGDDPDNRNILWRSDLAYGTEVFNVNDTLSMETSAGDNIVTVIGNDEAIFVLKDNSVKVILSDFTNDRIRIDDFVVGDYGCVSARSACQLENGIAYLTADGVVYLQADKKLAYLGENDNGVSRIKDSLTDPDLDLTRACAVVDTVKGQYKLFVPRVAKNSAGLYNPTDLLHSDNPYYTDDGVMFVYDYNNDAWFKHTGINGKGGMVMLQDRLFVLTAYARNGASSLSSLEWALYKERDYPNLWAYGDRLERSGVEALRAISKTYSTDHLAFDDPNELKKFLRCKVYGLRVFDDLLVYGTSGTLRSALGSYTLTVESFKDWREDTTQSSSEVSLSYNNRHAFMKCRNNKSGVMKFTFTHNTLYSTPRIQALEVEVSRPFKGRIKPWSSVP